MILFGFSIQTIGVHREAVSGEWEANPACAGNTCSLQQDATMALQVWHSAGDSSSDLTWYTKRAALAAIYSATELYMLTGAAASRSN